MLQNQSSNSMLTKNSISIKRNKSTQMQIQQLPDIQKYDTNKLFEQFKRHLLKQDKKQLNKNTIISNQYKKLFSEVKKSKQFKYQQINKLSTKLKNINQSRMTSCNNLQKNIKNTHDIVQTLSKQPFKSIQNNSDFSSCKFKPIRPMTTQAKFRVSTGKSRLLSNQFIQSRLVPTVLGNNNQNINTSQIQNNMIDRANQYQAKKYGQKTLGQISQSILMIQVQQVQLQQQITSLKQSLNKLKKQLQTVNKQLQTQGRNQQKYKHIMYLANSIKNQTDYIKLQNCKGYQSMMSRQDDTISQLKKFKTNLRKQKDQMETVYIEEINLWVKFQQQKNAAKKRQFLFSALNTPKQQEKNKPPQIKFELINKNVSNSVKSSTFSTKSLKKLIDQLDTIVQLLKNNEQNFQQIQQRQCTRVRLGKINKELLPKNRIQIQQRIEQFEQKYDMKISSIQNLILSVYKSLYKQNKLLQSQCLKLSQTKQQLVKDLKQITNKHELNIINQTNNKILQQQNKQICKINNILKHNSLIFIKIIQILYNMLYKFRYMFSLALTLDIDKKSFRDCIIQIDSYFNSGLFFNFHYQKHLITSSQRHDIINQLEFKSLLIDKQITQEIANQLTQLLFNDHRVNLILHKSWIQNKFKYLVSGEVLLNDVLDIIESLRIDCQQIYKNKLPSLSSMFLTCFKSILLNKNQNRIAAYSNQRGSLFLPTGPTKKFHYLQIVDQNNQSYQKQSDSSSYQPSKKKITFTTQNSMIKQQSIFQKDPRKIIYHLQEIKNKNHKKFKALNFACQGKSYKYNQQIVIPDFPMINENDQF